MPLENKGTILHTCSYFLRLGWYFYYCKLIRSPEVDPKVAKYLEYSWFDTTKPNIFCSFKGFWFGCWWADELSLNVSLPVSKISVFPQETARFSYTISCVRDWDAFSLFNWKSSALQQWAAVHTVSVSCRKTDSLSANFPPREIPGRNVLGRSQLVIRPWKTVLTKVIIIADRKLYPSSSKSPHGQSACQEKGRGRKKASEAWKARGYSPLDTSFAGWVRGVMQCPSDTFLNSV